MMPLQNRVLPTGEIVAIPARGLFMGNRGILHDDQRRLGSARWRHKAWICCRLSFKDRRRTPMSPGRYTELFFLDEAVALAAGHRPCAECRRTDYIAFMDAWERATGQRPKAVELDRQLHAARLEAGAQRRSARALGTLPAGCIVLWEGRPHLVKADGIMEVGPDGYGPIFNRNESIVTCLTPAPMIEVLRAGYRPVLHPSAR